MKKISIICGLVLLGAWSACAQGSVTFNTYNGGNFALGHVFLLDGTTPVPSSFRGELYWSDSAGGPFVATGSPLAFTSSVTPNAPGTIQGGSVFINGRDPGVAVQFQLRVWNGFSATYEGANVGNGLTAFGISQTKPRTLAGTDSDNNIFPPQQFNTFANFVVGIPEPSSMALLTLGGATLMLFRRKNRPQAN